MEHCFPEESVWPCLAQLAGTRLEFRFEMPRHTRTGWLWAREVLAGKGPEGRVLRLAGGNVVIAGAYWSVAVLVEWYFSRYQMWPAPIWFPAGVSMFAVFWMGPWIWPGIFLGSLLTNTVGFGQPILWSAIVSGGNTLGPLLAVGLIREHMRLEDPFARLADVFYFALGAILHGAIAGLVGSAAVWATLGEGLAEWPRRWFGWMMSDTGASLLVVPLLLLLRRNPLPALELRKHAGELLVAVAASFGSVIYLLSPHSGVLAADAGASFIMLLPLLWLSTRFSARVGYPMFVATVAAVIAATLHGYGPYAGMEKSGTFFIFAQMAIGFGVAVLLLGASSEEQRAAEKALRELNLKLESRVVERTAELQEKRKELERFAFHDALTGLPNRRMLEERFAASRSMAERTEGGLAFVLIDLDHFKTINDNLGHDAGDALLIESGRRLRQAVREYDVVARMGGDEFAVLLDQVGDPADVESVCARIVKSLAEPLEFRGLPMTCSASVGVALCPNHGDTWLALYKAADLALYRAKRAGRTRWEWHSAEQSTTTA